MKKVLALAACTAIVAGAERSASACSCGPPPPPCERFWDVDAVFTGKVTNLQPGPDGSIVATISTDEKFRGPMFGKTVSVVGGGMCGTELEAGENYFVYASSGNGAQYYSSLCGRTRKLAAAAEDLAYARSLKNRTLGVIEGKVSLLDEKFAVVDYPGTQVVLKGTTYAASTDRTGRYKLQVPAGKYTLDVVGAGVRVHWGRLETVELRNTAACARRDITVEYNGRIQGQLVDHTGKPAASITVTAHALERSHQQGRLDAVTDASGNYLIEGVQKGSYVVAVSHFDEGGPSAWQPIPPTFYAGAGPGVASQGQAKPVTVTRSGLVATIDFKLPRPMAIYKISGVLKKDGKPLPDTHINIDVDLDALGGKYGRRMGNPTDANGRFEFRDVAGVNVTLEVCRPDAGPDNYKTACRFVKRKLDKDLVVDVEYPK